MAFARCPLIEFKLPSTIITLESNALLLTTIPYIYIPKSLTNLDQYAFNQAANLNWFEVSPDHTLYASVNGFLMDKGKRQIVQAPRNVTNEEDFPDHNSIIAWSLCSSNLVRYIAKPSLTYLQPAAFYATPKLIFLDLSNSNVTRINDRIIEGSSVRTLILPKNLVELKAQAFNSKLHFPLLIIPDSCTIIEEFAFNFTSEYNKLKIVYLGSTDFTNVKIFSERVPTIRAYVTPYYIHDYFGQQKVYRNWINEPMTHNKAPLTLSHFLFTSILLFS